MRILRLAFTLSVPLLAAPLAAHELWIEPLEYQVAAGGQLQAQIVNGQTFDGTSLPYLPQRFRHFIVYNGDRGVQVPGRAGDLPAMRMSAQGDGLNVVAYESTVSTIAYESWEKFQTFVDHKDFGDVRARHDARGLPESDFTEAYTRYSKSLIGVGGSAGSDTRVGLVTEIVALTNPYTDDLSNGMRVQLFFGEDVRANEQIEVFAKAPDDSVDTSYVRTDGNGIATIPVQSGVSYQLDAVVLREPSETLASTTNAVWETLWANMTFAVP